MAVKTKDSKRGLAQLSGDMEEDATEWVDMVREHLLANRQNELKQALKAAQLQSEYEFAWIGFLKDAGDLPVSTMTIRNRVRWGQVIVEYDIDLDLAAAIGQQKILQLDKLGIVTQEWLRMAEVLSGADWTREIKRFMGENPDEAEDNVPCPVCGDGHLPAAHAEGKIKNFLMRFMAKPGYRQATDEGENANGDDV